MHNIKHLEEISNILSVFTNRGDLAELLQDVCTDSEISAIYQRLRVAQMLKNGLSFTQIEELTGMSSTTITRVNKCLKYGKGYNKMFNKYNLSVCIDE